MPLPRPPPKGGTGGKPIIPGASPRRRCPTAGATGFGFLASNQGITNTPRHRTCTYRRAPPWPRCPHHTHRQDKGRASPGGKPGGSPLVPEAPKPTRRPGHSRISPGGRAQHPAGTRSCGLRLGSPPSASGWQRTPGPSRAHQTASRTSGLCGVEQHRHPPARSRMRRGAGDLPGSAPLHPS